jgi:predicted RNA binding protein YcfA (HicA-like mRNA interferase family)
VKVPLECEWNSIRTLGVFGYSVVRQSGSHIRLRSVYTGQEHLITIPNHSPIKIGTVNGILGGISKLDLVERLFG